ncbi:hypothetical protein NPIL_81001 [Nephila pilipes]|uniref:Uncharacterized protein n=1 Tax=Nephila pilipes TaxID=299642 RepID=A0A8X6P3G8_NEPPI|nr:hypothetical protein NPIL_81001 [Nephila pilipes]
MPHEWNRVLIWDPRCSTNFPSQVISTHITEYRKRGSKLNRCFYFMDGQNERMLSYYAGSQFSLLQFLGEDRGQPNFIAYQFDGPGTRCWNFRSLATSVRREGAEKEESKRFSVLFS